MPKSFAKSSVNFSETNPIFRLFQLNGLILLLSSIITFAKQHFGNPIDCIYDGMLEQEKSFVDTYCWKNYEPIVPQMTQISLPFGMVNKELQVFRSNIFYKKQSTFYLSLPLTLLIQSILAYVPTWLWSVWRDKRLYETISSIKEPHRQPSRRKLLVISLANDLYTESIQRRYAKPFFFCELLNIVSFIFIVLLANFLFQHEFLMYGIREMRTGYSGKLSSSTNPELFPTLARCSIQLAKKESGMMKEEAICMISFNSLCENVFKFIWIWFVLVALASILGMLYRIFMMLSRGKRKKLLREAVDCSYDETLSTICEKLGFYSWFSLYRISRNVDPLTFQDIISALIARIDSLSVCRTVKSTARVAHSQSTRERTRERTPDSSIIVEQHNPLSTTV